MGNIDDGVFEEARKEAVSVNFTLWRLEKIADHS